MVDAGLHRISVASRDSLFFAFDVGEEDARLYGERFDLILVPVIGGCVDCWSRRLCLSHSVGRCRIGREELHTGAAVFGRDGPEVGLLCTRRLSVEKGEHSGGSEEIIAR